MSLAIEAQSDTPDEAVKEPVHPKYIEDLKDRITRVRCRLLIFDLINFSKDPEESLLCEAYRFYQENISAIASDEAELDRVFNLDLEVARRFESEDPKIQGPIKTLPDLINFETERLKKLEEELTRLI